MPRRCPNEHIAGRCYNHALLLAPATTTVMVDGEGNYLNDASAGDSLKPKVDHESEWWYCADCGDQAVEDDDDTNPEDATEGLCYPIMLTDADPTEE